ncbi:MAG TPA: BON domain-containing protein [Actinomycetota bacterium]|nr:BON domain-containing protein [Actinomycetota bacterium]
MTHRKDDDRGSWLATVTAFAGGALAMFLFDPQRGRTRRARIGDKATKLVNRSSQKTARAGRRVASQAYGAKQKAAHAGDEQTLPPNDQALAAKVESEVLSRGRFPKGRVSVNAEDGIVVLRGELDDPAQIADLEQRVRKVTGVLDVQNLLHLPGEPAPNKEDALRATRQQ